MKLKTIKHFTLFLYLFSFLISLIWLYINKTAYLFAALALVYAAIFSLILKLEVKTFKKAQIFGLTILQNFIIFLLFLLVFILNKALNLKTANLNFLALGTTLACSILMSAIAVLTEIKLKKGEIC